MNTKITLIVPAADFHEKIEYPNLVAINLEMCLQHARETQDAHPDLPQFFNMVFPGEPINPSRMGMGMLHVYGRLDLTLKLIDQDVKFMWQYPEAGLHPKAQVELGDVVIALSERMI